MQERPSVSWEADTYVVRWGSSLGDCPASAQAYHDILRKSGLLGEGTAGFQSSYGPNTTPPHYQ